MQTHMKIHVTVCHTRPNIRILIFINIADTYIVAEQQKTKDFVGKHRGENKQSKRTYHNQKYKPHNGVNTKWIYKYDVREPRTQDREIKQIYDCPKTSKTNISIREVNLKTASLVAQVSSQDKQTILYILSMGRLCASRTSK